MISPELLRFYPFFAGLTLDQIMALAMVANEEIVEPGHYFFYERDELRKLFLVIDGKIDIVISIPDHSKVQNTAEQILGNFITKEITVSTVGPRQIFAWSALIPPHTSTAGAKAATPCHVVAFGSEELFGLFQEDCHFGYLMLQKVANVIRQRLHDMRIQSLAFVPA